MGERPRAVSFDAPHTEEERNVALVLNVLGHVLTYELHVGLLSCFLLPEVELIDGCSDDQR